MPRWRIVIAGRNTGLWVEANIRADARFKAIDLLAAVIDLVPEPDPNTGKVNYEKVEGIG